MNINVMKEEDRCHYCHLEFNGIEEGLIQPIESGEAYYHLRCIGKLMVYRIEGVLPQHLFLACVDRLQSPLPLSLKEGQTTLDDFSEEE
tara:strand:+ start:102 stop:368 length:267 start_codon:yes stop_codon:yes gene_type:complete